MDAFLVLLMYSPVVDVSLFCWIQMLLLACMLLMAPLLLLFNLSMLWLVSMLLLM
jgi:hypothetical protein